MNKYERLITAIIVGLSPGLVNAAPIVSGVDWVDNTTIRITGSAFGVKSPAAPQYWADFESSTAPNSLSVNSAWPRITASQVNTTRLGKNTGAARGDLSVDSYGRGPRITDFNHDKFYIHYKRFYDFHIVSDRGPLGFNLKSNRFWGWSDQLTGTAPYGNNLYIAYQGSEGVNSGRAYNEYTSTQGATWFDTLFSARTWQTEEITYQASDPGVKNGIFHYVRDGVDIWSRDRRWQTRDSSRPNGYNAIVFDQVSNGTASGPLYVYYDNIYIDNTWARVMLCESSSWANCKQQEVQIPIAWSDTQIDVKLNLGDLNVNSSMYVYVINANDEPSLAGKIMPPLVRVSEPTSLVATTP